jgi:release factor glutamine methyltransferase
MRSEALASARAVIADGAAALEAAGVRRARPEALRIWAELTGGSVAEALLAPEQPVPEGLAAAYASAVRRRTSGEPLAQVTGVAGFRHLTLGCDRRALIPRPETEGLVELVLARVRGGRVADVGTGSGCIALSLATEGGYESVVGLDRSAAALRLAAENRARVGARVTLVQADLCDALRPGSLDALVSNPPYLTAEEYAALDPAVRDWEPELALAGGRDGLDVIGRLLEDGLAVLRPGGWLALEIDCARAELCAARAGASGWTDVAIHADLFGRERYLLARRSNAP